jgi:hypothetical protein
VDLLNVKKLWFLVLSQKSIELGEKNGKERHHFHDIHLHGAYSHFIGPRKPFFWEGGGGRGVGVTGEKSLSQWRGSGFPRVMLKEREKNAEMK